MADKSPRQSSSKKSGKTLKHKRADKKAAAASKDTRVHIPTRGPPSRAASSRSACWPSYGRRSCSEWRSQSSAKPNLADSTTDARSGGVTTTLRFPMSGHRKIFGLSRRCPRLPGPVAQRPPGTQTTSQLAAQRAS